jgi:hypothetical protein
MKRASLLSHLRDIIILPFTVTVIVPYLLYNEEQGIIPDHISLKIVGWMMLAAGAMLFFYSFSSEPYFYFIVLERHGKI